MSSERSIESLQAQLDAEIAAHLLTKDSLKSLTAALEAQRQSFQTWALALEAQVEGNNQTLANKLEELETVKKQLEALNGLSKGEERDAWNSRQSKHESELNTVESMRKAENEEMKKALSQAENESIEKESLYKSCSAELYVAKEFFQKKEASLTLHIEELTAQLTHMKEANASEMALEGARREELERNYSRSESERTAAQDAMRKLQTEVSLLNSKLKASQLENFSLQETIKRQCQEKAKAEGELMLEIMQAKETAKAAEVQRDTAIRNKLELAETHKAEIAEWNKQAETAQKAQERQQEIISNWELFHEDCRAYLQSETPSETMERYQRDLSDYRAQLGKCQISLSKYEEMIEIGKEKLKALELVAQTKEREADILRKCLKSHKIPVPSIPEGTGLGETGKGSVRGSVASSGRKKPQVTNEPCACRLF